MFPSELNNFLFSANERSLCGNCSGLVFRVRKRGITEQPPQHFLAIIVIFLLLPFNIEPEAIPTSSLPGTGERWLRSWNAVSGEQQIHHIKPMVINQIKFLTSPRGFLHQGNKQNPPYIFLSGDFYIRGTNRSTIYYNQIKFLTSPGPRDFYIKGNKQNLPKETMIKNDQRLLGKYYKVLHKLSFS